MQVAQCCTPSQRTNTDSCPQCGDGCALELLLQGCTHFGTATIDHMTAIAVALHLCAAVSKCTGYPIEL